MKTWLKGIIVLFANLWIVAAVVSNSTDKCILSSQEAEKWKNFTAFHPKLTLLLSDALSQELKTICGSPGLQNPPLSVLFNVERLIFNIIPASSNYATNPTTSISPAVITVPNGFEKEYPAFLAWKTDVAVYEKGVSMVTDYDKIDLDSLGSIEGKPGIFTAKVTGVYYIAFSQMKYRDLNRINVIIRRNDKDLLSNTVEYQHNVDAWSSIFTQTIIRLEKRDKVRVFQDTIGYSGQPVNSQINSMLERTRIFTGFLIPNTTYWTGIKPQSPITAFPYFSAYTTHEFDAADNEEHLINYEDSEQSDIGTIDPKTGIFKATVRGIYYLSFLSNKNYGSNKNPSWNLRGFIQLLKNDAEVVAVSYCDHEGAGSRTVIMHFAQITMLLDVGDKIHAIQRYGMTFSFGLPSTSLIGFLVVPVPQVLNVMATNYPVFNAHRSTLVEMNKTKVTFDLVTINQGGHLNGQTGVFVAPVKGYYFFSYCDTTLKSSRYTVARIVKNGNPIAVAHAHSGDGITWLVTPLSVKATLQLETGDNVYVEQWGIGTGDGNSTKERSSLTVVFTGFLLYPNK